MNWRQFFVELLKLVISWPVAVLVLAVLAHLKYKAHLQAVLMNFSERVKNLTRLKGKDVSAEFGSTQGDPAVGLPSSLSPPNEAASAIASAPLMTEAAAVGEIFILIGELKLSAEPYGLIGVDDALAMAKIQSMFLRAPDVSVRTAVVRRSYARIEQLFVENAHIVSVGGPAANKVTRALLDLNPVTLSFQAPGVIDLLKGETYAGTNFYGEVRQSGDDLGIVYSLPNPSHPKGRAVILAGWYSYGTLGAAEWFADPTNYARVANEFCEALIRVPVVEGVIQKPVLITQRPLSRKSPPSG